LRGAICNCTLFPVAGGEGGKENKNGPTSELCGGRTGKGGFKYRFLANRQKALIIPRSLRKISGGRGKKKKRGGGAQSNHHAMT